MAKHWHMGALSLVTCTAHEDYTTQADADVGIV